MALPPLFAVYRLEAQRPDLKVILKHGNNFKYFVIKSTILNK